MANFDAVLFDWMLTLAHYPMVEDHLKQAMQVVGRPSNPDEVSRLAKEIEAAGRTREARAAGAVEDTSLRAHRYSEFLVYEIAGIDTELASALYGFLGTPEFHPLYPDTKAVLDQLHAAAFSIGVVSDIHVDLRVHAELFGIASSIDAWSLSWEQGIQKPDLQMFRSAIEQLDCDPKRTLMVGDRGAVDGAAAALGVTCLILPAVDRTAVPLPERGLSVVLDLVGQRSESH